MEKFLELDSIYALSSSGWMNMKLFHLWFSQHFKKYIPSCRQILLLIDWHKSHYNPDTICLAAKEQVILFTLPPNTTRLSQPLDRSYFGPFKVAWREAIVISLCPTIQGKLYQLRYSFSKIFNQAMTSQNIVSGFKRVVYLITLFYYLMMMNRVQKSLHICLKAIFICFS